MASLRFALDNLCCLLQVPIVFEARFAALVQRDGLAGLVMLSMNAARRSQTILSSASYLQCVH
jgi:hypothetical protein